MAGERRSARGENPACAARQRASGRAFAKMETAMMKRYLTLALTAVTLLAVPAAFAETGTLPD